MAKSLKLKQRWALTSTKRNDLRSRIIYGASSVEMEAYRVLARTMRLIVK